MALLLGVLIGSLLAACGCGCGYIALGPTVDRRRWGVLAAAFFGAAAIVWVWGTLGTTP